MEAEICGVCVSRTASTVTVVKNATSSFSLFKGVLPKYFSSEWSFAHFRVPDLHTIVAFGQDKHSVIGSHNSSPSPLRLHLFACSGEYRGYVL
jgi:hypothetical protein